jgi:hypothetical protein
MIGSRVGVLTDNRQTRRQVARALYSGGIDVAFAENADGLTPEILRCDLLIIDGDNGNSVELALERVHSAPRPPSVILLSLGADKRPLFELVQRHDISNLVAKHGAIRAVHPVLDERELLVTCEKVLRRNIFGIDKYVGSWGVVLHKKLITSTRDKQPLMTEFEAFLRNLDCPGSVVPAIVTVAEELLLNAVVHAPHDKNGRPRYEHLGPDPDLTLLPEEYVEVIYGCDGQRLMLSVSDHFGRLAKSTLYRYLTRGFSDQIDVETKSGGAGLGLSLSYRSIHQLIFNIQDRRRTEVIAGWYLRVHSASEFRNVGKSLNLFWLSESSEPVSEADNTLVLSGRIHEATSFETLGDLRAIDLRHVHTISSRGVIRWLDAVSRLKGPPVEVRGLPEAMVLTATQVSGVLNNLVVQTLLYPFECDGCAKECSIELPPSVESPSSRECPDCGGLLAFAGVEEHYAALARLVIGANGTSG